VVPQDSHLWSQLHTGVLTTSILLDALGLRERAAGKRLGLPKHEVRTCVSRRLRPTCLRDAL
jgi:hypothetical protein